MKTQFLFSIPAVLIAVIFAMCGCDSSNSSDNVNTSWSVKVIFPDKVYRNIKWSDEELNKDIAIRHLYASEYSSASLIRLKGDEVPHYYDYHDLTVTAISGRHTPFYRA